MLSLFNPNLGFEVRGKTAGRGWGVGEGRVKLSLCLKIARIMLETSNLARKYTRICRSENMLFSTKALLILLLSTFLAKSHTFFGQTSSFTQRNNMRSMLEIF